MTSSISMPLRSLRWVLVPLAGLALGACASVAQLGPTSWPGVSANEDHIYLAAGNAVFALDLEGDEEWRFPAEPEPAVSFYAAPAVSDDGLVYAGAYNGHVYAIDAASGELVWEFPDPLAAKDLSDGRVIGSPVIAGDLLLVPTDGEGNKDGLGSPRRGTLLFLDRASGEVLRSFDAPGPLWAAPLVDDDTAYVASLGHTLHAIDLATAEERWSIDLSYAIADTPAMQNGTVLTGILGGSPAPCDGEQPASGSRCALVAVDAAGGEVVWRAPIEGWLWSSPAISDGTAVFGDVEGNLYAIDLASGDVLWRQDPGGAVTTAPVLVDGIGVVGLGSGEIIAYDLETQDVVWRARARGPVLSRPVVTGPQLIVAISGRTPMVQSFDLATGDLGWEFSATGRLPKEPGALDQLWAAIAAGWGVLWNNLILNPMINILLLIYDFFLNNFAIAIILLTVLIRLLTMPLTLRQQRSMERMQELQRSPKWQAIEKKYKGDRQRIQQEQLKLYREAGVSPFGGCLPLLLQLPILIGLYQSITRALAAAPAQLLDLARHVYPFVPSALIPLNSHFLSWDLSQPESVIRPELFGLPFPLLTILVAITSYFQTKLTTPPAADPQARQTSAMMGIYMPILMAWITWSYAAGLALYFLTTNVLTIVQYAATGKVNWRSVLSPRRTS